MALPRRAGATAEDRMAAELAKIMPAPSPWTMRMARRLAKPGAAQAPAEPAIASARPRVNTRLRPARSAMRPAGSSVTVAASR